MKSGGEYMRKWLKKCRESKKMSQAELSNALGITQTYYSKIESGSRLHSLSLSMMNKLADVFGISIEQIAEYENKKSTEVGA